MKEETMDATVYVGFDVAFSDMFKGGKNYTRKQFINKGSEIYCRVQMPDENSMNTIPYIQMIKIENGKVTRFPVTLSCESMFAMDWFEIIK